MNVKTLLVSMFGFGACCSFALILLAPDMPTKTFGLFLEVLHLGFFARVMMGGKV